MKYVLNFYLPKTANQKLKNGFNNRKDLLVYIVQKTLGEVCEDQQLKHTRQIVR